MTERQILFSGAMVRAILEDRKTQTRRVVKFDPSSGYIVEPGVKRRWHRDDPEALAGCPFGSVGDVLWVRENCKAEERDDGVDGVRYLSDGAWIPIQNSKEAADRWVMLNHYGGRKKGETVPSIHMPRWACRLRLEITGVKAERLQDISEEDARAEGVENVDGEYEEGMDEHCTWRDYSRSGGCSVISAEKSFETLWDSINSECEGCDWQSNPWVWALTFKKVK